MASAAYLAKYLSSEQAEEQLGVTAKKKRKKKKKPAATDPSTIRGSTVTIHDEDAVWAKDLGGDGTDDEDAPVVVELEDTELGRPKSRTGASSWRASHDLARRRAVATFDTLRGCRRCGRCRSWRCRCRCPIERRAAKRV
jgi:hypothetical protein